MAANLSFVSSFGKQNCKNIDVPRGVTYCCVPLCKSYSGKIVDGKLVSLHRIPESDKHKRRSWIRQLSNVRKDLSVKPGTRVCSLHFEGGNGPQKWCPVPTIFPSKPPPQFPKKRPLPNRNLHSPTSPMAHGVTKARRRLMYEDDYDVQDSTSACDGVGNGNVAEEKMKHTGELFIVCSF